MLLVPGAGNAHLTRQFRAVPEEKRLPKDLETAVVHAIQRDQRRAVRCAVPAVSIGALLTGLFLLVPHMGEALFEWALCSNGWITEGSQCGPLLDRFGLR